MEVQMFWYYLLAKLDDFNCVAGLACVVSAVLWFVSFFLSQSDPDEWYCEENKAAAKKRRKMGQSMYGTCKLLALITLAWFALAPSTRQAAFIWIAPQIVENGAVKDTVKSIHELTKLGTEYLKELLKEKVDDVAK